ncbi:MULTISPECIES: preprotein translocase subunit YajC [unclassified Nocardioides]|uniref:preprotein translocase subunit YajC n=1 Tax=unclassified Nocardioides TaxID=2615069 RepID=UPI0006FC01FA|nr:MULTISPECIES: preprotein translocase subunit YajC [unclassified Nocardioides]KQY64218.1 hypothetical protein ASD30_04505 [Nocardioides sp. Root140]KQZ70138.1 hypothetical protein ASD66_10765 [Nocardioides sp. Root151]KRF16235.1 hypothetical protein ASH02_06530 [Nocardioides sp. Soil796]
MKDLLSLLPIIGIFLIFWLLVIRPASRRQKEMQSVQRSLEVGDDVITNSGIFGTIRSIDDDKIGLEVATGVVLTVARAAIVGLPRDDNDDAPVVGDADDSTDDSAVTDEADSTGEVDSTGEAEESRAPEQEK